MEFFIIIASLSLAGLISLVVHHRKTIEVVSVIAALVVLIEAVSIAYKVAAQGIYNATTLFSVDALGAILLLIVALVGLAAIVYSIKYLRAETDKNILGLPRLKQYFVLLHLFFVAMCLAIASSSPIFAWVTVEATTLSTAFLVSFYNKPSAMEAAWKYLIINSVGLLLCFLGTLLYFTSATAIGESGFATWHSLLASVAGLNPLLAKMAFVLVLIGYGTKVGFAPMHTWKPDAYSKAPAPIGALFSGALLPVAFFIILKFKVITDSVVGPAFSQRLLLSFGLLSVAVPAFIMLVSKNYKRLLAYSSIENAGLMALGFGFGGLGVLAGVWHLIYHSFIKSALFFLSGNFLLKYHSAKIANVKGALNVVPITSVLFLAGFLAITGAPPFGVFFTKLFIFSAGVKSHPVIVGVALLLAAIVFVGFLKQASAMVFGEAPAELKSEPESVWLIIPPLALLVLVLFLSFYQPPFLQALINQAAASY